MSEVGILSVHSYIPEAKVRGMERAQYFGLNESFICDKIGFTTLPRRADGEDTSHLAERAVRRASTDPEIAAELSLLVVVTQTPDGSGLPHVSAIVHGRLGLPETVAAFDISLGCSDWM
jgi:3-oxoacyl-[acyl-carrier-protein] synthase-3